MLKGQSAIEYLTTYGWMLLVIAIAGAAIYTTIQNQDLQTNNGLSDDNIILEETSVTNDDLALNMKNRANNQLTVTTVNISDPSTSKYVYKQFTGDNRITIGSSKIYKLPNITQTNQNNKLNVKIQYKTGPLSGLQKTGNITGTIGITQTTTTTGTPTNNQQNNGGTDGGTNDEGTNDGGNNEGGTNDGDTQSAFYNVSIIDGNSSITAGEDLVVDYIVNNTGDSSGTQDIVLDVNGSQVDENINVNLDPGDSSTGTLSWTSSSGNITNDLAYNVSSENISKSSTVDVTEGFSEPVSSTPSCSGYPSKYVGSGTVSSPYIVENSTGLQCMNQSSSSDFNLANFTLANNIDASGTEQWNSGKGFKPIDPLGSIVLDGNGHSVEGLTINRPSKDVGLFHFVDAGSKISDIKLSDVNISGKRGGALISSAQGANITDVGVSGVVTMSEGAGGIGDAIRDSANISKSYSTATVKIKQDTGESTVWAGGLVSYVNPSASISNSYATGNVYGRCIQSDVSEVGGLVGQADGSISGSYATGNVVARDKYTKIGGLVGELDAGSIDNSYAANKVAASWGKNDEEGGLVGTGSGAVSDSYWDNQSTGQGSSAEAGSGSTGLTTAMMQGGSASSNMNNFDFVNRWESVDSPDGYPALKQLNTEAQIENKNQDPDLAPAECQAAGAEEPVQISFSNWNGFDQMTYVEDDPDEGGRSYIEMPTDPEPFYATADQLGVNDIGKVRFEMKHPDYTNTQTYGNVIGGLSLSSRGDKKYANNVVSVRDTDVIIPFGATGSFSNTQANEWINVTLNTVYNEVSINSKTKSWDFDQSAQNSVTFDSVTFGLTTNRIKDNFAFSESGNFKISENYSVWRK